ncbi:hypothetical protein HNQ64_002695 [Prosthecobacter dejongeii]|uniref:Uncharacterized protein n=1 Tax=Prosthecobacter dejongeii TaxID=48465 RepID=A0A7W8DQK8_9BACT|nr:hypothetical protein [Prosthecobacter dejongeii]
MRNVTDMANPLLDIWPYVHAIPSAQMGGHELWDKFVEFIYRSGNDRYDLVHVCTQTPNVFLVIVVDRRHVVIHGHRLLDFNELYSEVSTQ